MSKARDDFKIWTDALKDVTMGNDYSLFSAKSYYVKECIGGECKLLTAMSSRV